MFSEDAFDEGLIARSSTSNSSAASGGMSGGKPRVPYALKIKKEGEYRSEHRSRARHARNPAILSISLVSRVLAGGHLTNHIGDHQRSNGVAHKKNTAGFTLVPALNQLANANLRDKWGAPAFERKKKRNRR